MKTFSASQARAAANAALDYIDGRGVNSREEVIRMLRVVACSAPEDGSPMEDSLPLLVAELKRLGPMSRRDVFANVHRLRKRGHAFVDDLIALAEARGLVMGESKSGLRGAAVIRYSAIYFVD